MLPMRQVDFTKKNFRFSLVEKKLKVCYHCNVIMAILKKNSAKVLSNLKFGTSQYCYCERSFQVICRNVAGDMIGRVTMIKDRNRQSYTTHSFLQSKYHGIGMGMYLYALAADWAAINKVVLHSSQYPSELAKRMWKSQTLRQYYLVIKKGRSWIIRPRETTKLGKFSQIQNLKCSVLKSALLKQNKAINRTYVIDRL